MRNSIAGRSSFCYTIGHRNISIPFFSKGEKTVAQTLIEEYRRAGRFDATVMLITKAGGFSDETNWEYRTDEFSAEELEPIEAVLRKHMSPTDKIRWCLSKIGDRYTISKVTWIHSLWGSTPEELAQEVLKYYLRYPMLDKQHRSLQD